MTALQFTTDQDSGPRAGRLTVRGVEVKTPTFMPVGTRGTVKSLTTDQVAATGASILLANTYHLALRPGEDVVQDLGGLHRFMNWDGPILTDSGGFQVFSLAALTKISDEGVHFQSSYDGSKVFFTPEKVVEIQGRLGSDLVMPLDQCVPWPVDHALAAEAVDRTVSWAARSQGKASDWPGTLFGIVQGSCYRDLREQCAEALTALDFPGYAVGGLSVGEGPERLQEVVSWTLPRLPRDRPRYVMGIGPPRDLLTCIAHGADMFDCVLPTRNGRSGYLFTRRGVLRLRNAVHVRSQEPIDEDCRCLACRTVSRGYLRHLFNTGELLAMTLATIHNLTYFNDLMSEARQAILDNRFEAFRREVNEIYSS